MKVHQVHQLGGSLCARGKISLSACDAISRVVWQHALGYQVGRIRRTVGPPFTSPPFVRVIDLECLFGDERQIGNKSDLRYVEMLLSKCT